MRILATIVALGVIGSGMAFSPAYAADTRIALVVKALGIGFFEAAAKGAEEAAAELGNVEIIYTGEESHEPRNNSYLMGFRRSTRRQANAFKSILKPTDWQYDCEDGR